MAIHVITCSYTQIRYQFDSCLECSKDTCSSTTISLHSRHSSLETQENGVHKYMEWEWDWYKYLSFDRQSTGVVNDPLPHPADGLCSSRRGVA